ncbi:hypothetical protein FRC09_009193 [Ceratobasidium sp. 395]|nr:hypothetical protein FRC09_009193 [Ceratobasidium sp. 395]
MTTRHTSAAGSSLRTALASNSIKPVDIDTLERIECSRDVAFFLHPATPKLVYQLLETHTKRSSTGRLLDDRYGQICLRILIRLVQILVCETNGTLEYLKVKMEDASTDAEVSAFLAEHTAALSMGETAMAMSFLTTNGLLGKFEGLFNDKSTCEMLGILWEDRKSVLMLYKNGSLQGFLLLLYVVWTQVSGLVGRVNHFLITRLRDLLFRVYLVTTRVERNHIRTLCLKIYEVHPGHEDKHTSVDAEDSRAVVHAYYRCIMFPADPDPENAPKLEMFRYLLEFTSDLIGPYTMDEELPLIVRAAIERLWQAYDTEKTRLQLPPTDGRSQVMYYMGDLQYALSYILAKFPPGKPARPLVEAFAGGEWPNAVAKYMLHCCRQSSVNNTVANNPLPEGSLDHDFMSGKLAGFKDHTEELCAEYFADWVKIMTHLRTIHGMYKDKHPAIARILHLVKNWTTWGAAMGFGVEWFYRTDCAYPRCPGGLSTGLCGTCGLARYCTQKCQHA